MTVTEESRHRLHQALDRTIGPEEATTLMEHLPPVGWADVATKQDLAHLEERLDLRFEALDTKIDHRYDMLDARFGTVDERFKGLDQRFKGLDERFKGLNDRFDLVGAQINEVGQQITRLGERMDRSDRRYEMLIARVDRQFWQFIGLIVAISLIVLAVAGLT